MTTTEHKCWRFFGTPIGQGLWGFECKDCTVAKVSTLTEHFERALHDTTPEPDGSVAHGIAAALGFIAVMAGGTAYGIGMWHHNLWLAAASVALVAFGVWLTYRATKGPQR